MRESTKCMVSHELELRTRTRTRNLDMDPITLQLYRHRFAGVAEEMGVTLRRTSYSPNIKERLDFSCALFDGAGQPDRTGRPHPGPPGRHAGQRPHDPRQVPRLAAGRCGHRQRSIRGRQSSAGHHDDCARLCGWAGARGGSGVGRRRARKAADSSSPRFPVPRPSPPAPHFLRRQPRPPRRRGRHDAWLVAALDRDLPGGHHHPAGQALQGAACWTRICCA